MDEYPDVEVVERLPNEDDKNNRNATPLEVLEDLMLTGETEQVRCQAARTLAEYKHKKMSQEDTEVKVVNFNVTMDAPARPMSLRKKE